MRVKSPLPVFGAYAVFLTGGLANAQNIVNDPDLLTLGQSGSPWTLNNGAIGTGGPSGDGFFQTGCSLNCFDPVNGSFIAETITLPAADYNFSLLYNPDLGEPTGSPARTPTALQVDIFPVGDPADQLEILNLENTTPAGWNPETGSPFDIAKTGQYEVKIYGEDVPGSSGVTAIDIQTVPTSTPEPGTFVDGAAALGVITLLKRRRLAANRRNATV